MEKINIRFELKNLEVEIRELKLRFWGDTGGNHQLIHTGFEDVIIILGSEACWKPSHRLYGRVVRGEVLLARHEYVCGYPNDVDYYDEFFCTGQELKF